MDSVPMATKAINETDWTQITFARVLAGNAAMGRL